MFQSDLDALGSSLYHIYYSTRLPAYCVIRILEVKGKSRESGREKKVGQGEEGQSKKDQRNMNEFLGKYLIRKQHLKESQAIFRFLV